MSKGKWLFSFVMDIDGDDGIGGPLQYNHSVSLELPAINRDEALNQAKYNMEQIRDMSHHDLRKFCPNITSDDTIKFGSFCLTYKEVLDFYIPDLTM